MIMVAMIAMMFLLLVLRASWLVAFANKDPLDACEVAAGKGNQACTQQSIHDVQMRHVIGTKPQQMSEHFKHDSAIIGE